MINPDRPLTREELDELGRIAPDFRRRVALELRFPGAFVTEFGDVGGALREGVLREGVLRAIEVALQGPEEPVRHRDPGSVTIDWSRFDRQLDCVPPPKRCAGAEDDDLKAREPTAEQLFRAWERVRRRDPLWPSTLRRY